MTDKMKIMKAELKMLAKQIKTNKPEYKQTQREVSALQRDKADWTSLRPAWNACIDKRSELGKAQYEFRHKHIAYCMLRGRTLDQIETLPKDKTLYRVEPDMDYINALIREMTEEVKPTKEEVVCTGNDLKDSESLEEVAQTTTFLSRLTNTLFRA